MCFLLTMILVVRGVIARHGVDHDFFSCGYDSLLLGSGMHGGGFYSPRVFIPLRFAHLFG